MFKTQKCFKMLHKIVTQNVTQNTKMFKTQKCFKMFKTQKQCCLGF